MSTAVIARTFNCLYRSILPCGGKGTMILPKLVLSALCFVLVCASGERASAQADKYEKPVDLKPLVPPVFPLPPQSQINPGTVSGTRPLDRNVPLQSPDLSSTPPPPGFRLSIPSRQAQ